MRTRERGGGHEARVVAVLDGTVGERDGDVGLAALRSARQDEVATLAHELGPEERAELLAPDRALEREVEFLDGLEVRKVRLVRLACDARAGPVRDLLGQEPSEELVMGPLLGGGLRLEVRVFAQDRREMKTLEQRLELDGGRHHAASFVSMAATTSSTAYRPAALQRAKAALSASSPCASRSS